MERARLRIGSAARMAWWWLRQVLGDAAYENYLCSAGRRRGARETLHPCCNSPEQSRPLLTREEFYLDALRRRYSGVSRCC